MSRAAELPMLNCDLVARDEFRFSYASDTDSWSRRAFIRTIERFTGQPTLRKHYLTWMLRVRQRENIFDAALRLLDIGVTYDNAALARVPADGPLLVVANHPFGVADGLAIGALMAKVRPDIKIMCHSLLCQPEETRRFLLPVDFGNTAESRQNSARTRIAAQQWLKDGHCLIIFPGGAVATRQKPLNGPSLEHPWHSFTARLAAIPEVKVQPIFFHGENSRLFHVASHLSYPLRVALLFRETLRLMGKGFRAEIGNAFDGSALPHESGRDAVMRDLLRRTMSLGTPDDATRLGQFTYPKRLQGN